ncbi:XdhC family protein [Thauera phenolivorans]|uniref:XdhC family protein n=1 Tax=Thauera phenolivorans TaxID=1792543 RepID=UPI000B2AB66F|nr:XdhC family protein [Thauera phenolivorans]
MEDWLVALADCRRRGSASVLVTVAAVRGSAPRDAGAHMVVYGASIGGTIGGGRLEQEAVAFARALLASGGQPRLLRHALGPSLG